MAYFRSHILVCMDPLCQSKGAIALLETMRNELTLQGLTDEVRIMEISRIGGCAKGPEILVYPDEVHYVGLTVQDVPHLVSEHFLKGRIVPAHEEEIAAAEEEGIQFHFLSNPVEVLGEDIVTGVRLLRQRQGDVDNSGRRRVHSIPGSEFDLPCDVLIPAIGQATDFDWLTDNSVETIRVSTFKVGQAYETTVPGVFAAGDAVLGPASVIDAVAQGNKVAAAVDTWLTSGKLGRVLFQPPVHIIPQTVNLLDYAEACRPRPSFIPLPRRLESSFVEVEQGYDETMAREEARRCLRCDLEWVQYKGGRQ
jgi:(2Fe-2S) ferredoxin